MASEVETKASDLYVVSDSSGTLGVWDSAEKAEAAISGHKGPAVAQAWPRGDSVSDQAWIIPSVAFSDPPRYVTASRDRAIVTHHAFAEIGAVPAADTVDGWNIPINSLTPLGEIRMREDVREWTEEDRKWVRERFAALEKQSRALGDEGGSDSAAEPTVSGGLAELIVRRDRTEDAEVGDSAETTETEGGAGGSP